MVSVRNGTRPKSLILQRYPKSTLLRLIFFSYQERLAEGGSGAFMFFCGNGEFVVKTILKSESETLLAYVTHL